MGKENLSIQKKKRKDSVPQSVFEQSKINSDVEKNDISQIVKSQKKIQSILNQTNFEYGNARQPARKKVLAHQKKKRLNSSYVDRKQSLSWFNSNKAKKNKNLNL